jgi:ABC-type transporter Mla subunit MlaD
MGLFEDVVVNAKSAVDVVGKKAGKFVDVSKLRINAADINNEISRKFEELGRAVYEAAKDGSDTSNAVSEHSAEINDLYDQLNAVNAQLASARERLICKNCGNENVQGATYCSKCGAKLTE